MPREAAYCLAVASLKTPRRHPSIALGTLGCHLGPCPSCLFFFLMATEPQGLRSLTSSRTQAVVVKAPRPNRCAAREAPHAPLCLGSVGPACIHPGRTAFAVFRPPPEPFPTAKLTEGSAYRSMGLGAGRAASPSGAGGALQASSLWRTRAFTPIQRSVDSEE